MRQESSCVPAHKQTDPNKLPGQIVNPVETTLNDYIKRLERKYNEECCGNPLRNGGCKYMGPQCVKDPDDGFSKWWEYAYSRFPTVSRYDAFQIWEEAQANIRGMVANIR